MWLSIAPSFYVKWLVLVGFLNQSNAPSEEATQAVAKLNLESPV